MKFLRLIGIIFLLIIGNVSISYTVNFYWEVKTNLNNIDDILIQNDTLFAVSSGGFIVYPLMEPTFKTWTAENGLTDHHFTAISTSPKNDIILGTQNGVISFYNRNEKSVEEDYSLQGNQVNNITATGDTLWITTKDLIAVYLYNSEENKYQFRDFFTNFKRKPNTFRDIIHAGNKIFAASDNGLYSAPGNFLKFNLKAAENWQILTTENGLPSNNLYSLAQKGDTVLIGTDNGLTKFIPASNEMNTFNTGLNSKVIKNIRTIDDEIFVDNSYQIYQLDNQKFTKLTSIPGNSMNGFDLASNGEIWAAIREKGLYNFTTGKRKWFNGPIDNNLGEALLDSQGRLWVVSGAFKDERARGFSVRLKNGMWQNYRHLSDWKSTASAQTLMEDTGGNIWIGSWNGGLTFVDPELNLYHINNYTTTGKVWVSSPTRDDTLEFNPPDSIRHMLSHTINAPNFLVVTDILEDKNRQSIWLTTLAVQGEQPLIRYNQTEFGTPAFKPENWEKFEIPVVDNSQLADLTIDIFNNIWIGTERDGVLALQLKEGANASWSKLNENDNLKNNACFAVAADDDGYVWLGTQAGLNAYFNGNLFDFREDYQPIGLRINAIYVDAENNKWFATEQGLSLLKASGSPWNANSWLHFVPNTSEFFGENIHRTNLPSAEIRSVFVDDNTGDVYCGTASGLAILRNNPFTTPLSKLDQLAAGPNPFKLENNTDNLFFIRNLTANSQVKILTTSGRLVRVLDNTNREEVLGSTAQWNGRNEQGRLVSTGVYLYMVTDEAGNSNTGKILVIRDE